MRYLSGISCVFTCIVYVFKEKFTIFVNFQKLMLYLGKECMIRFHVRDERGEFLFILKSRNYQKILNRFDFSMSRRNEILI